MTREEFYLRAMLAMASNPKYVEVKLSEDYSSVKAHTLQAKEIQMDAERLLKEAQDSWPDVFEDKSENDILNRIYDAVSVFNTYNQPVTYGVRAFAENH